MNYHHTISLTTNYWLVWITSELSSHYIIDHGLLDYHHTVIESLLSHYHWRLCIHRCVYACMFNTHVHTHSHTRTHIFLPTIPCVPSHSLEPALSYEPSVSFLLIIVLFGSSLCQLRSRIYSSIFSFSFSFFPFLVFSYYSLFSFARLFASFVVAG